MKRLFGFAIIALTLGLFSCNNDDTTGINISEDASEKSAVITVAEVQTEAATTESDYEVEFFANAEVIITQWWKMGQFFGWNNKLRYFENHCPEIDIEEGENNGYPKTITLDYGDSTLLMNGKVLSGVIVIEISAHRSSQDYSRSVTYENFTVDSLIINGYSEVEVDKVDSAYRKFESQLRFTFPDGTEINRSAERVWQWVAGLGTDNDQSDDEVSISGTVTATITWTDGTSESYSKEITTPLRRKATCRYMVEGVVEVSIGGNVISVLDYGYAESDDECDQYAKLTTADGEEVIDLSERNYKGKEENNQNGKQSQNGKG